MAATDRQIADSARDSLKRILDTDTSAWSQADKRQQQLEIDRLSAIIVDFESRINRSTRQVTRPIVRVNI